MTFPDILAYVSSLGVFFPLIIAIIRRENFTLELKLMFVYIIVSTLTEIIATFWARYLHSPNHFMLNIFSVVECLLLVLMYREVFINKLVKRITLITISVFTFFAIFNFTETSNFVKFNSLINSIACIIIIICVFIYFFQLLQTLTVQKLSVTPMFWISVACLLYFSGTLFLFLYGETVLFHKSPFFKELWVIYFILSFIFRIFLAIGLWFSKTPLQLKSSSKSAQS
ncbi:hypothetical protein HNP25_001985 [Arcicella rosea]|uniref:Uncharacterized protein n=1 Tax=Arcicella rosea TaxID=502909 RepID=A0A841EPL9_9BACT|nr:hypothetical protein [Arcicella rosea]